MTGATTAAAQSPVQQYAQIREQVQRELALPFTDPNDPGLYERRKRLRELFSRVPDAYAKAFYDELGVRPTRSLLSSSFHDTLATPTRLELLGILRGIYEAHASPSPPATPPASPKPPLVWWTSPLPPSESGRFDTALRKLEDEVKASNDPRKWRYNCWFEKLKKNDVDDRVVQWSRICPYKTGALGAAFLVGPCDLTTGPSPIPQEQIVKGIGSVGDVDAKGRSLGIMTYLKADIVVSEEMTVSPLESLRGTHDEVQRAIEKLRLWADNPMGGSSAMSPAYISIKDWIGERQSDSKSVYSCH
jgi:hypothetical protein